MKFTTTIYQESGKNHAGIPVPDEVVEALGAGKRPLVVVTIGKHSYRSSIASMGGQFMISMSAANRTAADVVGGDTVEVTIEVDTAPREVDIPEALATALSQDKAAREAFEGLSNSRKSRLTLSVDGSEDRGNPAAPRREGDQRPQGREGLALPQRGRRSPSRARGSQPFWAPQGESPPLEGRPIALREPPSQECDPEPLTGKSV